VLFSMEPSPTSIVPPPPNFDDARYLYLVGRLRNRQITMEEATELFVLQQAMIRAASRPIPPPPPAEPRATAASPIPSEVPRTPITFPPVTDETVAYGLLALGAGAGLVAALLKRASESTDARTLPGKRESPRTPTDR
jgi:hypothetical protein